MFCLSICCAPHVCLVPKEARRGCLIPKTGVTDGCEPLFGCWELNVGPLEEQPLSHSPALYSCFSFFTAILYQLIAHVKKNNFAQNKIVV